MTAFMLDVRDYIRLVDLSLSIRLSTVDSGLAAKRDSDRLEGFHVGSGYLVTSTDVNRTADVDVDVDAELN